MCNKACLAFAERQLNEQEIRGKQVIEIGSMDVNGSIRPHVEALGPASYLGVDLAEGNGVDAVCNVHDLVSRFGAGNFDVAISSEMIEHVRDWRDAISQIKAMLRPGGVLLMTTRSFPFPYHDYPYDYWRFEIGDMKRIFGDMEIEALEPDLSMPGVLLKARKPHNFDETDLSDLSLYSMVARRRTLQTEFSKFQYFVTALLNSFVLRKLRGAKRRLFSRA